MGLNIVLTALSSRSARSLATNNSGVRRIATSGAGSVTTSGGIVTTIISGAFKFGASIVSNVIGQLFSLIGKIDFKAIWGAIVAVFNFVWNFDWHISDESLDAQIKGAALALAGSLGGTIGNALGYLVCGAAPAALMATVNEPLALLMFLEVGEAALDDIADNVANLVKLTAKSLVQTAAITVFKNVRSIFHPVGKKYKEILVSKGTLTSEQIDKAVEERSKPWSFASAFQERIEAIPNEYVQEFIEELIDEFSGSCIESGYAIAGALDTFYPSAFSTLNSFFGPTSTVTVSPIGSP